MYPLRYSNLLSYLPVQPRIPSSQLPVFPLLAMRVLVFSLAISWLLSQLARISSTTTWHTAAVVHAAGIRGKRSLLATLLVLSGGSKIFNIENDQSFERILQDSKGKVLVLHLTGEPTSWRSRITTSIFEQLAGITHTSDTPSVICKADVDKLPSLRSRISSRHPPAFLFIKDNQVLSEVPKSDVQQLKDSFKKHVSVSLEDVLK